MADVVYRAEFDINLNGGVDGKTAMPDLSTTPDDEKRTRIPRLTEKTFKKGIGQFSAAVGIYALSQIKNAVVNNIELYTGDSYLQEKVSFALGLSESLLGGVLVGGLTPAGLIIGGILTAGRAAQSEFTAGIRRSINAQNIAQIQRISGVSAQNYGRYTSGGRLF